VGEGRISRTGATMGIKPRAATRVAVSLAPGSGRVIRTADGEFRRIGTVTSRV
jgi:hypothetical protein